MSVWPSAWGVGDRRENWGEASTPGHGPLTSNPPTRLHRGARLMASMPPPYDTLRRAA